MDIASDRPPNRLRSASTSTASKEDRMNGRSGTSGPRWLRVIQWIIVLSLPILLVAISLRIVTGHWFVRWEYNKASFPPDPFGLSTAARTRLAEVCVDYLATNADISLLADLQLPGGEPAFNERELRHMADVQTVYSRLMLAGLVAALVAVGGIAALLTKRRAHRYAAEALLRGGGLTVGLLLIVGAIMLLSWGEFFTAFHRVFFEGDSWTFPYSDTLIRLFPMRFWMDVAILIVGLLSVTATVTGVIGWIWTWRIKRRTEA